MGSVFPRGNKLWLKYKNVAGRWINKPSQLDVGNEKDAANLLQKIERRVKARVEAGETEESGPSTVASFAKKWLAKRTTTTAGDDKSRLNGHALPFLGPFQLDEVRPRHVRELVSRLVAGGKLAPKAKSLLLCFKRTTRTGQLIQRRPLSVTNPLSPRVAISRKRGTWKQKFCNGSTCSRSSRSLKFRSR